MGHEPHDDRLRDAFRLAEEKGISYDFIPADLGPVHPNTVKFEIENHDGAVTVVTGSSTGGGAVLVTNINGYEVSVTGDYCTIIVKYTDIKGVISKVSGTLSESGINIATMNVSRKSKGKEASMIIETDGNVTKETIDKISKLDLVSSVIEVKPVKGGGFNV